MRRMSVCSVPGWSGRFVCFSAYFVFSLFVFLFTLSVCFSVYFVFGLFFLLPLFFCLLCFCLLCLFSIYFVFVYFACLRFTLLSFLFCFFMFIFFRFIVNLSFSFLVHFLFVSRLVLCLSSVFFMSDIVFFL